MSFAMLRRLFPSYVYPRSRLTCFSTRSIVRPNCGDATDSGSDSNVEIKSIIVEFLRRSGYKASQTEHNGELRNAIRRTMLSWKLDDNLEFLERVLDFSSSLVETVYGHTSFDHQYHIALYSVIIFYIDDIGNQHLEAIGQFTYRFTRGEKQLSPALDALVELLRQAHDLFTRVGADDIIAGTLDAVTAMYIEYSTQDLDIKPQASLYPYYLRTRSGICRPYVHFNFMKSWRETPNSYLQALPYMERWINGSNDIFSFYKEEKAGETKNYVHLRACTEETSAVNVLRELCRESLTWSDTVLSLSAGDGELITLWERYVQKYLEFYVNTKRYRLSELNL